MKTGTDMGVLMARIEELSDAKADYIVDTRSLEFRTDATSHKTTAVADVGGDMKQYEVSDTAHSQVATKLAIPKAYYDRMKKEDPELLDLNVNRWFRSQPDRRMLRTYEWPEHQNLPNVLRSFMSDRYRRLDHIDMGMALFGHSGAPGPLATIEGLRVESADLTSEKFYLKMVTERITGEVKKGDVVQAGIMLSNSEVGAGSVKVYPMLFRLMCLNGAIMEDAGVRKTHIGKALGDLSDDMAYELFSDKTLEADDRAFWMRVGDIGRAIATQKSFDVLLALAQRAAATDLATTPVVATVRLAKKFNLFESEKDGVLKHLTTGSDMTRWGLANAVTAFSQEVEDYERATQLEALGGKLITLPDTEWSYVDGAAA